MAADLDSLCWKIYERTLCQPWQIEQALRLTVLHLRECGWIEAANHLAPPAAPPTPKTMDDKPVVTTGNPDELFNKELAVYANNIDAEHF